MFETEVADASQAVSGLSAVLDPASVPLPEVPALWRDLDAMEREIAGAKLRLATAIEDSGIWSREGFPSAAHWLAKKAGTTVGRARRDLKASGQIKNLPATDDAVREGKLSPEQTAEVASAATADPSAERKLLDKADGSTLHELKDECEKVRAGAQPDDTARDRRVHEQRRVHTREDAEGGWNLSVRNTRGIGARFEAALEPFIQARFDAARRRGEHESRAAYAADR